MIFIKYAFILLLMTSNTGWHLVSTLAKFCIVRMTSNTRYFLDKGPGFSPEGMQQNLLNLYVPVPLKMIICANFT